jgi:hypothetical protein
MSTIVTENNSNNNSNNGRWTPFREGLVFKKFIETWREGDYEVDENLINKVSDESSEILSKCINPKENNLEKNNSTGLVIGQVQSGKTLSMTAVSAMAKDNGYGIVIVMSGNVTTLSSQTAERFSEALGGRNTQKIVNNPENTWYLENHLSNAKLILENFVNTKEPEDKKTLLVIIHKNPARINHISELFESIGVLKDKIPTLIIDDEADHHSLNSKEFLNDINSLTERRRKRIKQIYQICEGDTLEGIAENFSTSVEDLKEINNFEELTGIGSYILTDYIQTVTHSIITELKANFNFHTYLGYTATPQAISLIPRVNELSPEFVHVIKTGSHYTGLDFFFPKQKNGIPQCSKHIENIEEEDVYKNIISDDEVPPSLEKAICYFMFGVAVGIFNNEHRDEKKNRSMIIHPHHLVAKHRDFEQYTIGVLRTIRQGLKDIKDVSYSQTTKKLEEIYSDYTNKFPTENYPKFNDNFIEKIQKSLDEILPYVILFNAEGKSKIPPQIWKDSYARILIGGFGLDRGYTIKGLTITYLSRDKSKQDDTLLQRARFFGYHKKYHQFVRVFLSRTSQEYYKEISEINTNFLNSIIKFQSTDKNFKEWPREWWGTNAADHELTRPGVMRDITLKRFKGDKSINNKYSHLLSTEQLRNNQEIYNNILIKSQSSLKQINHLDNLKNSHKVWSGNRDILITENFSIEELYENYIKKLNFHENEMTKFEVVKQNLATYTRKFGNRPFPVMFLYINHSEDEDRERTMQRNGSINPFRGRDKKNPLGFPGDLYLHYDYLIGATNDAVGLDNLTLKINFFQRIKRPGEDPRENVPYFHFVPSIKIWKDYIKGIYK